MKDGTPLTPKSLTTPLLPWDFCFARCANSRQSRVQYGRTLDALFLYPPPHPPQTSPATSFAARNARSRCTVSRLVSLALTCPAIIPYCHGIHYMPFLSTRNSGISVPPAPTLAIRLLLIPTSIGSLDFAAPRRRTHCCQRLLVTPVSHTRPELLSPCRLDCHGPDDQPPSSDLFSCCPARPPEDFWVPRPDPWLFLVTL